MTRQTLSYRPGPWLPHLESESGIKGFSCKPQYAMVSILGDSPQGRGINAEIRAAGSGQDWDSGIRDWPPCQEDSILKVPNGFKIRVDATSPVLTRIGSGCNEIKMGGRHGAVSGRVPCPVTAVGTRKEAVQGTQDRTRANRRRPLRLDRAPAATLPRPLCSPYT